MIRLQEDFYSKNDKMYVATDCIIFGFDEGKLKLLIFRRRVEPLKNSWSLIGSFVRLEEDVDQAAKRVLTEITGLENVFMEELRSYGKAERDPGFRSISIGQYALIRLDEYDKELVKKHGAHWYEIDKLPELVLDHNQMVEDALERLKRKARYKPIGFELLPEKFTIPQLQQLYEAIYQKELDARNFRKKVLSLNVLVKLDEKDKSTSRRGAFLYKFDHENYQELLESGYDFKIA
ncbi:MULTISPECIES: NUDIX hydrolase [Salegentibacter]|uniref:NUDIX hydrolase n=1 Tax=Salegentibacter maritimus TaxID=2794347 RepID=A0ABS0TFT9_9FLAO|nr:MULTISPECIES: NUDIX domain-containing protein [Salegentibacter]MBE7639329.1 NUDIX domain-containing protein [Salegentibacter sp. BLCTC]MBI6117772.1 NUDIX hydrolase [Salegentibacter maritimus]MBI6119665.1 NUDIX hydrolase [Salegentibacter maritimus]